MLFLSKDELNTTAPQAHEAGNYRTATLKNYSNEFGYLKPHALVGEFRGLNSVFEFLNQYAPKALKGKESDFQGKRGGTTFFFNNYQEAMDCYTKNPSQVRKFSEKDEQLDGGDDSGRSVEYDLTGDYIDIDRFIEGVPEVFGHMTSGNPRARRVWIVANLSWVHNVSDATVNARCARIARLVDWLESQQIRCSVTGIESTGCGHIEIQIKDFDEPLDLNDIAVLAHNDFLRRILFRYKEYSETFEHNYGGARVFSEAVSKDAFMPSYNTEYSVFLDTRVNSPAEVHKDFDGLETWLTERLIDDQLEPSERSLAILR